MSGLWAEAEATTAKQCLAAPKMQLCMGCRITRLGLSSAEPGFGSGITVPPVLTVPAWKQVPDWVKASFVQLWGWTLKNYPRVNK